MLDQVNHMSNTHADKRPFIGIEETAMLHQAFYPCRVMKSLVVGKGDATYHYRCFRRGRDYSCADSVMWLGLW